MARVTHAAPHLSLAEVKNRMRNHPRAFCRQRWLIIYNALVEPRKAEEIARHCGVSKATVHDVISRYNRFGVSAIETKGQGGRRRQYLALEEEKEFLAPFFAQAECGEIATVEQIWHAYAQRIGHEVDDSTVYRLLHRPDTGGARVPLCLCCGGPNPGPDGLADFARSLHCHDESLSKGGQPRLFYALHCHASGWGWLASGERSGRPGQYPSDLPACLQP